MSFSQNADGWTIFLPTGSWHDGFSAGTPANTTNIIYVSSLTGSNANDGSFAAPIATLAHGVSLMRDNSPDWLLLTCGETWTDEQFGAIFLHGLSSTEYMVFGSYDKTAPHNPPVPNPGTAAQRPLIKTANAQDGIANFFSNIGIIGLEFYTYTQDPDNPSYGPATTSVVGIANQPGFDGINNVLVEDCKVSFYTQNIELQPQLTGGGGANFWARRNISHNAWDTTTVGTVSVGIGSGNCSPSHLIEENLFDHNGWNALNLGSSLNHNCYLSAANNLSPPPASYYSDLTFHGNIISSEYWLSLIRCGGHLNNSLWFVGNHDTSYPYNITNTAATNLIENDIYIFNQWTPSSAEAIQFGTASPDGDGNFWQLGPVAITNCIFTQSTGSATRGIKLEAVTPPQWDNIVTINNNIAWGIPLVLGPIPCNSTFTATGYNIATSTNTFGWLNPNRSPATYMSDVIGIGSTYQDYIDQCKLQRRGFWRPLLMAESVNDYIRQGFNLPFVGSAYADTQGGAVTGSGATVTQGYGVYRTRSTKMPHA